MILTRATEKDIPLIQDLARKSWEHAYAEILSAEQMEYMLFTMYSMEEIAAQLQLPLYHYYLIKDEGDDSYGGFVGYENGYEEKTTKLHRIYLVPESKGKGVGKHVLGFLKEKTAEYGDRRIILNVNKYNPARNFYESQGFRIYDKGVFDIGNGFVMDDYLMEFCLENQEN